MANNTFDIALETGIDYTTPNGNIRYDIADYAEMKRQGLPTPGITVHSKVQGEWVWEEAEVMLWIKVYDLHPTWLPAEEEPKEETEEET